MEVRSRIGVETFETILGKIVIFIDNIIINYNIN